MKLNVLKKRPFISYSYHDIIRTSFEILYISQHLYVFRRIF